MFSGCVCLWDWDFIPLEVEGMAQVDESFYDFSPDT
jgi:hypothetical protein